jgi:hypothetical protein
LFSRLELSHKKSAVSATLESINSLKLDKGQGKEQALNLGEATLDLVFVAVDFGASLTSSKRMRRFSFSLYFLSSIQYFYFVVYLILCLFVCSLAALPAKSSKPLPSTSHGPAPVALDGEWEKHLVEAGV